MECDPVNKLLKWGLVTIGSLAILYIGLIVSLDASIEIFSGVHVEVINRDLLAMQHVSVEVTGATYQIGDISSGFSKSVKVRPHDASAVTINYSDITGVLHHVYIDTYIENGYFDNIKVQVKNEKILHVEQSFKVTPFFLNNICHKSTFVHL